MKLLLIDVNYKRGSTGKIIANLSKGLRERGHETYVAYGRGNKVKEKNVFKFAYDFETIIHALLTRITGFHGSFSILSTINLIRIIKKIKPDVIHIHELHGYFVNIESILRYLTKKRYPIVWTFHCEYMYEGKGYVYNKDEDISWSRKKEYPASLFFDFSKFQVKRYKKILEDYKYLEIIVPSKWSYERLEKTFYNTFNINIVFNPIDEEIFKRDTSKNLLQKYISGSKKIILSVAPNIMDDRKGGEFIIHLANMCPEYHFVLVGVSKIHKLPMLENATYISRTENIHELINFYSNANLTLLTSKRETFSMVCLESLSCGTRVVGFKSGAPETIFIPPFGRFCDYGDLLELKKLINTHIHDVNNYSEIRDFITSNFHINKFIETHNAIYEHILIQKE